MKRPNVDISSDLKDFDLSQGAVEALAKARDLLAAGDLSAAADWLRMAATMADAASRGGKSNRTA